MMTRSLAAAAFCVAVLTMSAVNANAQNFFWSLADLDGNVSEGDLTISADVGDTGTAFLYYSPEAESNNISIGFDFDFSWENSGIAGFLAATTFDFNISIQNIPVGVRWRDFSGPAEVVSQNTIEGLIAINA